MQTGLPDKARIWRYSGTVVFREWLAIWSCTLLQYRFPSMRASFVTRQVELETTRFDSIDPCTNTSRRVRVSQGLLGRRKPDVLRVISLIAFIALIAIHDGYSRTFEKTPTPVMILQGVRMMLIILRIPVPRHRLVL